MPTEENGTSGGPPPIEFVKQLLDLMAEHDLAEVEVEEQGRTVRLRKAGRTVAAEPAAAAAPPPAAPLPASPAEPAGSAAAAANGGAALQANGDFHIIASPMVGTFYRAGAPDADAYVEVGDPIEEGTLLCIIEAMKVMNDVKAEVEGEIVEILARNSEPVEYGQPLFKVKLKKG